MKPSIWPHFTANDVLYYLQHTGSGLEAWNLPRYTFQPTHAILILGCLIDWNFLIFFLFWEFHGKWKRWRRKSTETDISFSWYNFSSVTWKSSAFSIFSPSQRRPPFHGHYSSGCCYVHGTLKNLEISFKEWFRVIVFLWSLKNTWDICVNKYILGVVKYLLIQSIWRSKSNCV